MSIDGLSERLGGSGYAVFDVDTRRLVEREGGELALELMGKAKVIERGLGRVLDWAEKVGAAELVTTCLTTMQACEDGEVIQEGGDLCHMPMGVSAERVDEWVGGRRFVVGRPCEGCRDEKISKRYFDAFAHHQGLARLIERIDAKCWVVMGASFDICLRVTAEGLVRLGQEVVVLEDVTLPSPRSTEESMRETKEKLREMGVRWMGVDAFFEEMQMGAVK
ncbi:hypothetical protein KS4_35820 [Poriferisphaera corsica]|uniref:Uncharacterized protein n=1 Tax=Poriferisphaera corsica TaxID=2528020 RepID=A0A517YZ81_9BACT|nr:isochorismatase family protein [Poriferisphaera corsica]QDU35499.1 hypothetical protein KS4_35820 [Poriferisphaera corsica]